MDCSEDVGASIKRMKVLIVFATNSSGTFEASKIVRDVFVANGHTVRLKRAMHARGDDLQAADVVVLGSCTWMGASPTGKPIEGQLQEHMEAFVAKLKGTMFPGKRFAVFGLGDSSYTYFARAADHLERFVKQAKGEKVGPSLKIDGFFFDLDQNLKKVETWATAVERLLQ